MGAAAPTAARLIGASVFRADERALVAVAGLVFALASGGAAMTAAAADALFLAELGSAHLGHAVAVSSALLAIVLAVVGGLSDRLDRRRVLATLAVASAVVIAGLAALAAVAPRATAIAVLIGGKQLAAATDLAFWVVIAERIDARRSQRLLPLLAALGGAGAAVGAVLVVPLASAVGARGVLLAAALLLALSGACAMRLGATRRVATPVVPMRALIARSWRDGARAVRRHPLASHLAVVVAVAGAFASLAYFALGVEVAARGGSTGELAALLGAIRGGGQLLALAIQLFVAPRVLAHLGTGRALLLAPLAALAAGLGLVVAPILAVAIATQISARVLDASIETPAEKLAQTLLPTVVRGRVGGFLDGTAKRAGAVLGGVVAAALAGAPTIFYVVTAIAGALWLVAASRIARELPALAIAHVAGADARSRDDALGAGAVVDDRAVQAVVRELDGPRPERAADVLVRLHEAGRVDAVPPLVAAAVARMSPSLWRSLIAVLDTPSEVHGPALLDAARAATTRTRELAVRAVGLAGGVPADAVAQWLAAPEPEAPASRPAVEPDATLAAATARDRRPGDRDPSVPLVAVLGAATTRERRPGDRDPVVALAAEVAHHRLAGDLDAVLATLADAVRDPAVARCAIDELGVELVRALARNDADRALEAARHLARAVRRGRGDVASRTAAFGTLARIVEWGRERRSAELALLRSDLLELVRERVEHGASKPAPDTALVSLLPRQPRTAPDTEAPRPALGAEPNMEAPRPARGAEPNTEAPRPARGAVPNTEAPRPARGAVPNTEAPRPARGAVPNMEAPRPARGAVPNMEAPRPARGAVVDDAPEIAAALRLYGELLAGADAVEPDDLRRVARALGECDDDVRTAAEQALAALGPAAAGELIATAAWGRRRARDRAAALLAELPVTPVTIDRLVDAELDALEQTAAALAVLTEPGDELLARRLDERLREIAHTVLLLVAARRRSRPIARAAVAWRHSRGGLERARALAVIEAALPRALVGRLVEAVDDLAPADRAAVLARAGIAPPSRDAVMRVELGGRDRLSRALVLHALGASGRSAHRDTIAQAAHAEALAASATDLLRRLTEAVDDDVDEGAIDMPTRVETLIALGRVPLLAALSTRQLADVAERAHWVTAREGDVLITAGDPIDALIAIEDGELGLADRRIGKGEVVDELACVAPVAAVADLIAVRAVRLIRLERVDFEELVDDVPGLASAVCRALGERARRAVDAAYRSPLASRGG